MSDHQFQIAAAIPAKGTSSRVPNKNLQRILKVPLFLWAANNLSRVLPKKAIHIDSDSEEILSLATQHGFGTIRRPAELATNATDGNELMLWQASNIDCEVLIQHLPPMIFLRESTIRAGLAIIEQGYESTFAVSEEAFYLWDADGPQYDIRNIPNSFTLPQLMVEGMGFYIARKKVLESQRVRVCGKFKPLSINKFEAIDIDTPEDLQFAESIAKGLPVDSEYISGIDKYHSMDQIKIVILDIDGVMTDGGMYYSEKGDQLKKFNTKDGMAIKMMLRQGIEVRFLSSGTNERIIAARAETLGVAIFNCGARNKMDIINGWLDEGVEAVTIAYIGDDVNDLEVIEKVGFSACPSDAVRDVKRKAMVVLDSKGGDGCVRELWERYLRGNDERSI